MLLFSMSMSCALVGIYTKTFIAYLKFKFNWASFILSSNPKDVGRLLCFGTVGLKQLPFSQRSVFISVGVLKEHSKELKVPERYLENKDTHKYKAPRRFRALERDRMGNYIQIIGVYGCVSFFVRVLQCVLGGSVLGCWAPGHPCCYNGCGARMAGTWVR